MDTDNDFRGNDPDNTLLGKILKRLGAQNTILEAGVATGKNANVLSTANATTTPLAGGATFTGVWEECYQYSALSLIGAADVAGTLYAEFSTDGATVARTILLSDGRDGALGIHGLIPVAKYFRVRLLNGATPQGSVSIQTIFSVQPLIAQPTSRLGQNVGQYTDVLNTRQCNDILLDIARGVFPSREVVFKFGANPAIAAGSTEAVTYLGTLNLLTAASTVRIKSGGNAADTAAGVGARQITVEGLDSSFNRISETLATAGASASAATAQSFFRVYRMYVSQTGAYGSLATGANTGDIVVENSGGGTDLIALRAGRGQGQYGAYTIPAGYSGYLTSVDATAEGGKATDIFMYQRPNADTVVAPYSAKRMVLSFKGLAGDAQRYLTSYIRFNAKTDIWFEATGPSGGSSCSLEFQLLLLRD